MIEQESDELKSGDLPMESNHNEKSLNSIKDFRIRIHTFLNSFSNLLSSREVSLAYTNLQRAKMWLGKALGETGSPTPYPKSEDPTSPVIEPQADSYDVNFMTSRWASGDLWESPLLNIPSQKVHLARIKDLRSIIQQTINEFDSWQATSESFGQHYDMFLQQSNFALIEAKLWFGMELDRIREFENSTSVSTESK